MNNGSNIPAVSTMDNNNEKRVSTYFVENGSYAKLRTIQLGYNFPKSVINRILIDQLRIYASLDDWFTFTKYPGFDPEIVGVGASMGVDKGNYPTSKKVVFGVNVTF